MIHNNPVSFISSGNLLKIENNHLNIYYCYIPKSYNLECTQLSYLSLTEQEILDSIKDESRKVKTIFSRALLFHVLNKNGLEDLHDLKVTRNGKPYLTNSRNIHLNISYSGNLIICAISFNTPIGVDVEKIKPKNLDHFKLYFTEQEWHNISINENSLKRFYELWTRKEALVKADGRGLSIDLSSFSCLGNNEQIERENWYIKNFLVDEGYSCAIASKANDPIRLIKFEFSA
jgi:4'-phosphopantetheinyl transferase|tara:strand:- start:1638 stop:2333 length:696 start_codon:yes stop_codon:yes gene_type:complete